MTEYRFDSAPIRNWEKTPEGYLEFLAPIAKEGDLIYRDAAGNERREFVSRQTLARSVNSFIRKPITLEHPTVPVTAKNAKQYAVGWTANGAKLDDRGVLWLQGTVFDAETIAAIESGQKREISCGYKVKTRKRGDAWEQYERYGNHVAAVSRGRAGPDVAFQLDGDDDDAYWCLDGISEDLDPPELDPPSTDRPSNVKPPEPRKMKTVLDGLEIEVSSMDEAKHVRAVDGALSQARSNLATISGKLDSATEKLTQLNADKADTDAKLTALTTQLDEANAKYDSLKLDHDELLEGNGSNTDSAIDETRMATAIAERMKLWNTVLPRLRSDSPDFQPDFSLSPIEIMTLAVKADNPDISTQLDSLDPESPEAIGFIKGLFARTDAMPATTKAKNRVDNLLDQIFATREATTANNDSAMATVRDNYRKPKNKA